VLRTRHGLAASQPDDFQLATSVQVQKMEAMIERVLFLYVPLVGAVALVIGGIVAATLMLSAVAERVGEIGLRSAVGASPEDIRRQFVFETAAALVLGGVIGIGLGAVAIVAVARRMHLEAPVSLSAALIALVAATVTGLAAGVIPANRAARLNPVDALR